MSKPLTDIKVLDFTWVLSGPYASMVLSDLGADVIKVERPPWGDVARTSEPYQNGWSAYFFSINRGKRSVSIDLQRREGQALILDLVEKVDVVMENFTPGTMERLGIGYETLRKRNPGLIYASTSGFGQTGPYRDYPAVDIIVQGMGGVMSITGEPDGDPVRPGVSYGDIVAGLYTAIGILAALHDKQQTGEGQSIDISMLDAQVSVLENAIMRYFVTGKVPTPLGTRHPSATPFQAFPTKDGWIVVALAFRDEQWPILCALLGVTDLIDDPRFDTGPKRTANHSVLEPLLFEAFRRKPSEHWLKEFLAADIPSGPLNTISDVVADPQVKHREMIQEVTHPVAGTMPVANTPIRLSRSESGISGPPPSMGEHTAEVLSELLGLGLEEVEQLRASG
ncbi:MAG TPA: carnitine dehydratase, partial [Dehalococcoidia bacterium]|nr:carnitine dehydratase [Dehalococcoidia bacterium]